jgi:4a-hydroxytetrahydrobiopterin dehydratase
MGALTNEKCTACRRDSPLVTKAEIQELKPQIPDWMLVDREVIQRLERVLTLKDFVTALSFTIRVGALAEEEGHHPAILTEWGRVTVTLWTHAIHGLHRNDFIIAAKIDSLLNHKLQPGSNRGRIRSTIRPGGGYGMPTYEYLCKDCHGSFDKTLTLTAHDRECGSKNVKQEFTTFYPVTSKKSA